MNLTPPQIKWLKWLHENGGAGFLDTYGRVIANGAQSAQGTQTAWLNLFIKGMVQAIANRVVLTDLGKTQIGLPVEMATPGRLRTLRKTIEHYARSERDRASGETIRELAEAAEVLQRLENSAQEATTKSDPRSDKALLDWLESECANLTCVDEHGQDDVSVSWQVTLPVRLRPDEPADAYGTSPRQVIDYAMREQEIRERDLVK